MNIKRAFLAAVAVLMVPGFAMAQSTHTFATNVYGGPPSSSLDVTLTCNSGIPLSQPASTPVTFTVTEVQPNTTCTIAIDGALPSGYEVDTMMADGTDTAPVCEFTTTMNSQTNHLCNINLVAGPVDYTIDIDWDVSNGADDGVGDGSYVELTCTGATSTTMMYDAGPNDTDLPVTLAIDPVSTCSTVFMSGDSSVEAVSSDSCTDETITVGGSAVTCTIMATVFFEGIPTLSQYGMAIMALLMLAVGFVGFRRFV